MAGIVPTMDYCPNCKRIHAAAQGKILSQENSAQISILEGWAMVWFMIWCEVESW